jgi:drug/metabolite transporter (DMT)-like permease
MGRPRQDIVTNMNWLAFALMTVVSWGLYGILLHHGQMMMADKSNALYKSFLFVGLAYFLTAVLAPLGMLMVRKATWNFPAQGMLWSLIAGVAGAAGAFCVLLAFGAKGLPPVVMSIVFGGAPLVTAVANFILHPPANGFASIKPPFYLGILLAAAGGVLVTLYRPSAPPKPAPAPTTQAAPASANPH